MAMSGNFCLHLAAIQGHGGFRVKFKFGFAFEDDLDAVKKRNLRISRPRIDYLAASFVLWRRAVSMRKFWSEK